MSRSQLALYATAAGMGAFTLGQASTADASIVYTDVPDVTISIGDPPIYINLDGTGVNEFAIATATFNGSIRVNPYNAGVANNFPMTSNGNYYVNSFNAGVLLGPTTNLVNQAGTSHTAAVGSSNFVGTGKYVGLKWEVIGGETHYGWAQIDITGSDASLQATLTAFAYESDPGTAIVAGDTGVTPEPSALALLAMGAGALGLRRKHAA